MKIIAIVGDSHVWGDGAGAEYSFYPAAVCGDLRMTSFEYPTYVNFIRHAYDLSTNSFAEEIEGAELKSLCKDSKGAFAKLSKSGIKLAKRFALARIFFVATNKKTEVNISIDNKLHTTKILFDTSDKMNECVRVCNISADDALHSLEISGEGALIHRIELYGGDYAIVNCGVGSCTIENYLLKYFDDYITDLDPYAILFEGCTINDWINHDSAAHHKSDLYRMTERISALTDKILFHTVFPIFGDRKNKFGLDYIDYINALRETAREKNIPIVDCYAEFEDLLKDVREEKREKFLYRDPYHPQRSRTLLLCKIYFARNERTLHIKEEAPKGTSAIEQYNHTNSNRTENVYILCPIFLDKHCICGHKCYF